jgi:glycosyltransferase involved in cell wall biosynthesis
MSGAMLCWAPRVRVVFDHQIFSAQRYGGISRYLFEVANRLARRDDVDIEVFAPLFINQYFGHGAAIAPRGIKVRENRRAAKWLRRVNVASTRVLVTPRRDIDIFHETYYSQRDLAPRRARRVITVYDMIHERFPESFGAGDRTREDKAVSIRRADHVFCISENTRRDLIDMLGIPENKTSIVYLASSLDPERGGSRKYELDRPYLLYVGQRGGYKNFSGVLRAYAGSRLQREGFAIVSFGSGKYTSEELQLADELGIPSERLVYLAGDDEALACCYRGAAAFVYPSLYEGFGIPPLEAMAIGCPAVCSNTSSIPEVVGDAAELFDPTDESAIRDSIERAMFSPSRRDELIARGRARAAKFTWQETADVTVARYRQLLGHA